MRAALFAALLTCGILMGPQVKAEEEVIIEIKPVIFSLAAYDECQKKTHDDGAICLMVLNDWLDKHPDDWGKAAEMVRRTQYPHVSLPYFAVALEKSQVTCADTGMAQAVTSALALPAESGKDKIEIAREIVLNHCFAEMRDPVKVELTNSYVFANICKGMGERKALSDLQRKKCAAL